MGLFRPDVLPQEVEVVVPDALVVAAEAPVWQQVEAEARALVALVPAPLDQSVFRKIRKNALSDRPAFRTKRKPLEPRPGVAAPLQQALLPEAVAALVLAAVAEPEAVSL